MELYSRRNRLPWEMLSYFNVRTISDFPENPPPLPAGSRSRQRRIIGQSRAVKDMLEMIDAVAPTGSTVLITGETGVGKELVARTLHEKSHRRHGPFVRVNCSALAENLVASELFGHERGAFTGADRRHRGRFERADGGTLFLDEIGDIPRFVQKQLLRVIQSGEFERVGSQRIIRSDFRLITATNKNLRKEVRAARFRQDLYYRLNVFPVTVPPLRRRKGDIPLLVSHFIRLKSGDLNRPARDISDKDMNRFMAYDWPGNIRELENLVERGVILSKGRNIHIPGDAFSPLARDEIPDPISMVDMERSHILKVLRLTQGKINGRDGAAELLQLHPSTLRFRIKKLGLSVERRPVKA